VLTTSLIPLFPLPVAVFPGELLPLHIFEDRYKVMVARCIEWGKLGPDQGLFGVHFANEGKLEVVGCAVAIEKVAREYSDGRLDIVTIGRKRYRGGRVVRSEVYQQIEADFFDDFVTPIDTALREQAVALHCRLLEVVGKQFSVPHFPEDRSPSYVLAHEAGLAPLEKQRLLELTNENDRLRELVGYYRRIIPEAMQSVETRDRIHANGHFRHLKSIEI
jgi:ATP-dependent Lon protease